MGKIIFRLKSSEYVRLPIASECEKAIKVEIEKLGEGKLTLIARGWGAESPDVIDGSVAEKTEYLDYGVYRDGELIAAIEISCTNYSFDGSNFFPINAYKVERKEDVPTFFVYSLELEPFDLPNRCWWITLKEVLDSLLQPKPIWLKTRLPNGEFKPQLNYITDKNAWHQWLQTLVEELLKIADLTDLTS